ncbi:uncharacterized protein Z518_03545 [Rhinocladiella mackenziei CBS 650.93]|uniref:Rhinocladiella mackenziei CBS 650.93 unplaced genomic scaffold supercont1.2, whole genome shotgun sequence n=1 Tax=Rhinocladiella mackenziei CBS 650.93 TaxID=1442369 RepID=A0A0D2HE89_9EURO|nr:uncharacterized protein Z518_03545 [Rhinocladiella mackenziei CBS 650.93]KIX08888.1 hypothetical protein Z518_03545 [Rhinocladiella mackenziei CBS 650.93]
MRLIKQVRTLVTKDLLIIVWRRWFSTALRALALPIVYIWLISYVRNFFMPPSNYGFGHQRSIRSLSDVLNDSELLGGRNTVAFVHNGNTGGQIEALINTLSALLLDEGVNIEILSSNDDLFTTCQSSLRGTSRCYAAASFTSSPTENEGFWNYTAIADFSLGTRIFVDRSDNDAQLYSLPFIHAIDAEIANQAGLDLPQTILESPFTSETVQDRNDEVQEFFMRALINYLAVVFFIGICGVTYHLPGHMSSERESGMSQLIDTMVPNRHQWHSQVARVLATHISFDIVYIISWLSIGAIVSSLVFLHTDPAIVVLYHLLAGFALTGYSLFGGSLFRRSQLSGITVLIVSLALAIVAQFVLDSIVAQWVLSVIFPSVNYTMFIIYLAKWESQLQPANLLQDPPDIGRPSIPGYAIFILMAVQLVIYPWLATASEIVLYGTASKHRSLESRAGREHGTVDVRNFSKFYYPSWWQMDKPVVKAVENLTFTALRGRIVVLLGANGSGKSTTLSAISGIHSISSGHIDLDGTGGLGLCPQKNVLWDDLTVSEHVRIFTRLKNAQKQTDSRRNILHLIRGCDLEAKTNKKSKALSGGQKRKLQLAMAFTGGSQVCCIDEVSSGLDPLSRRKIWEILLSEKGKRTFLLTTHALDEADALSDDIVVLSKGTLRAHGSAVELKNRFGRGYRVLVPHNMIQRHEIQQIMGNHRYSMTESGPLFQVSDAAEANQLVASLEKRRIPRYQVIPPTIEDVFMELADELKEEPILGAAKPSGSVVAGLKLPPGTALMSSTEFALNKDTFDLMKGGGSTFFGQVWIIFCKRLRILTRNYLPYCCAVLVPLITVGLATFFLAGFEGLNCSLGANANNPAVQNLAVLDTYWGLDIPIAPADEFDESRLSPLYGQYVANIVRLGTYVEFEVYIRQNFRSVVPGGFWIGNTTSSTPWLSYKANDGLYNSVLAKVALDSYLLNTNIVASFSTFALPLAASTGDSLQLVVYFTFAMCACCGFFALYPTFERLSKVRALHYSNGVRSAPLWLANILYDSIFVVIISAAAIVLFTGLSDLWWEPGYLYVVFFLFGISSTLLSYIVSLFATSQLAAYAFSAGGQAVFGLIYFILYLVMITYSQPTRLLTDLNTVQYTLGLITPSGNLLRAMLLTLNQSQLLCRNQSYISYPGNMEVYGGPILYLVLQIFVFYTFLVWYDSGWRPSLLPFTKHLPRPVDTEKDSETIDPDVAAEVTRCENSTDGLRVLHLSKRFGLHSPPVVDNITFGIQHDSVFALLGPNGAGKSTTISLIRGDLHPSTRISDIQIEGFSVRAHLSTARQRLGVCPQFDAMDQMTVTEHLRFYASVRGVRRANISYNVSTVLHAIGLYPFRHRQAAHLSGGNQRKLSLGIAIIGNPSILLLDEPSSGMDAVAKRSMWRVVRGIKAGRGVVMTTHSMEEASALADRVGILARRMLALGTTNSLRGRYGGIYHVRLVHEHGAGMSEDEGRRLKSWVTGNIPGAVLGDEDGTLLHGQLEFTIPTTIEVAVKSHGEDQTENQTQSQWTNAAAILLDLLERHKVGMGIKYYSFSETTLEDVFLAVVGRHRVAEEEALKGSGKTLGKKPWSRIVR